MCKATVPVLVLPLAYHYITLTERRCFLGRPFVLRKICAHQGAISGEATGIVKQCWSPVPVCADVLVSLSGLQKGQEIKSISW